MTDAADPLDHSFSAPIGVEVRGDVWSCVEVPDSATLLGTGKAVRVDATVDGILLPNASLMPTGRGGHMLSLSAKLRKKRGKGIGDAVDVRLTRPVA